MKIYHRILELIIKAYDQHKEITCIFLTKEDFSKLCDDADNCDDLELEIYDEDDDGLGLLTIVGYLKYSIVEDDEKSWIHSDIGFKL